MKWIKEFIVDNYKALKPTIIEFIVLLVYLFGLAFIYYKTNSIKVGLFIIFMGMLGSNAIKNYEIRHKLL